MNIDKILNIVKQRRRRVTFNYTYRRLSACLEEETALSQHRRAKHGPLVPILIFCFFFCFKALHL